METSWRPDGDSSLRRSRRRRRDVSWILGGSLEGCGEIKHVRFFMRLFGDLFKSPGGLGDVAATWQRLNRFSTRKMFLRRLRDISETCSRPRGLRKSCADVSATLQRRLLDSDATSPRQHLSYFCRPRKEIIKVKLKLVYTCKT